MAKRFLIHPEEAWAEAELEELARKYDTVEEHGWYDNLNPSVDDILEIGEGPFSSIIPGERGF